MIAYEISLKCYNLFLGIYSIYQKDLPPSWKKEEISCLQPSILLISSPLHSKRKSPLENGVFAKTPLPNYEKNGLFIIHFFILLWNRVQISISQVHSENMLLKKWGVNPPVWWCLLVIMRSFNEVVLHFFVYKSCSYYMAETIQLSNFGITPWFDCCCCIWA